MATQPQPSLVPLTAQYLGRHARRLSRSLRVAADGTDVEAIHQVRVACRRLRAGFRMFKDILGKRRVRRWRRSIRPLAKKLGEARDLDVEIQATWERIARIDDVQLIPGVSYWLAHLERERARLQPKVRRAVRKFLQLGTLSDMRRWRRSVTAAADDTESTKDGDRHATQMASQISILHRRLQALQRASAALNDPADQDGHHVFRIKAKKLRYSLEAVLPVLGSLAEVAVEALKQIQEWAGEIHDYDVWSMRLGKAIKRIESGKRLRPRWLNPQRLLPGLTALEEYYRQTRTQVFDRLRNFCSQEKLQKLWRSLEQSQFLGDSCELEEAAAVPASDGGDGQRM
ncbi:CHAD domain-containing protein [Thermogutta sp.]|uniref:CHAD domain-containing protein n=1 Tax=Thermogutta sp. TaxID=1962930 RepID=UPI00322028F0